jgi:hypothetical protein
MIGAGLAAVGLVGKRVIISKSLNNPISLIHTSSGNTVASTTLNTAADTGNTAATGKFYLPG